MNDGASLQMKLKLAILSSQRPAYQIAATAGLDETRLSRIVQGRYVPTFDEKIALARTLNKTLDELFDPAEGSAPVVERRALPSESEVLDVVLELLEEHRPKDHTSCDAFISKMKREIRKLRRR